MKKQDEYGRKNHYEILRGIEVYVGNGQTPYQCSRLTAVGTRQEILDKMASEEYIDKITKAVPEMMDSLRDV